MLPTETSDNLTPEEYRELGYVWCKLWLEGHVKQAGFEPSSIADRHYQETGHQIGFGCCARSGVSVAHVAKEHPDH